MLQRNSMLLTSFLDGFKELDSNSIDMIVTSPPYWQARDYGMDEGLGMEKSPYDYVERFRPFFTESLRVLKPTGGLWFNIGDIRSQGNHRQRGRRDTMPSNKGPNFDGWKDWDGDCVQVDVEHGIPKKGFIGIPERLMFLGMDCGFILRDKIVWAKGVQMFGGGSYGGTTPSPIKDRFATFWEPVYYFTKSRFSYFNHDAVKIPSVRSEGYKMPSNVLVIPPSAGREKFSVKDAKKFATYPPGLIDILIKAGCPPATCGVCGSPLPMSPDYANFAGCKCEKAYTERGLILDPFCGSGTTAVCAMKYGVDYIMFDISGEQLDFAEKRVANARNK